ncbi:MAG TPA: hypothetical protein ENL10_05330 [Candidatus Cloacimonetes bacterium]|nr:hypothetical protein [Candidatus Cloacimonadota bacterium]
MANSRRNFFFKELTIGSDTFPNKPHVNFGFEATRIIIVNDNNKHELHFSFLEDTLDGVLKPTDAPIVFDQLTEGRIWFKQPDNKDVKVRVWAWRGAG